MYKAIVALLLLTACSKPTKNIGIIHDYVFFEAQRSCEPHQGLHYIVSDRTTFGKGKENEYPCTDLYKFRCQDGTVIDFDSGTIWCFISQSQLEETLHP